MLFSGAPAYRRAHQRSADAVRRRAGDPAAVPEARRRFWMALAFLREARGEGELDGLLRVLGRLEQKRLLEIKG